MSDQFNQIVTSFFNQYHDRGMMKWAGFYLSDHTQQLEKVTAKQQQVITKRPQLTTDEISQLLVSAFNTHQQVTIQLNSLTLAEDKIPEITGQVSGFTEDGLLLGSQAIELSAIRHIRFVINPTK